MKTVVVTGGIGSGKSEVCRILRDMGVKAHYNADKRVKALYEEHPTLLDSIEKALGSGLRDSSGKFQPRKLADIIFWNSEALETVESLVFPVLIEDFRDFTAGLKDDECVVFESATILEKPYFKGFGDMTVLVDAPYSLRLERASGRDEAPAAAVEARMACQPLMNALSEGHTDPRIDAVIMNDAGIVELEERTREVFSHLFDN